MSITAANNRVPVPSSVHGDIDALSRDANANDANQIRKDLDKLRIDLSSALTSGEVSPDVADLVEKLMNKVSDEVTDGHINRIPDATTRFDLDVGELTRLQGSVSSLLDGCASINQIMVMLAVQLIRNQSQQAEAFQQMEAYYGQEGLKIAGDAYEAAKSAATSQLTAAIVQGALEIAGGVLQAGGSVASLSKQMSEVKEIQDTRSAFEADMKQNAPVSAEIEDELDMVNDGRTQARDRLADIDKEVDTKQAEIRQLQKEVADKDPAWDPRTAGGETPTEAEIEGLNSDIADLKRQRTNQEADFNNQIKAKQEEIDSCKELQDEGGHPNPEALQRQISNGKQELSALSGDKDEALRELDAKVADKQLELNKKTILKDIRDLQDLNKEKTAQQTCLSDLSEDRQDILGVKADFKELVGDAKTALNEDIGDLERAGRISQTQAEIFKQIVGILPSAGHIIGAVFTKDAANATAQEQMINALGAYNKSMQDWAAGVVSTLMQNVNDGLGTVRAITDSYIQTLGNWRNVHG